MSDTLRPGTRLDNDVYRIIKVVDRIGFTITYIAEDVKLGRHVAVKEFFVERYCQRDADGRHVSAISKPDVVERHRTQFIQDARALHRMDRTGIVSIHTVFEENGTAYCVMDLLADVQTVIKKPRRILARIMWAVLAVAWIGLAYVMVWGVPTGWSIDTAPADTTEVAVPSKAVPAKPTLREKPAEPLSDIMIVEDDEDIPPMDTATVAHP